MNTTILPSPDPHSVWLQVAAIVGDDFIQRLNNDAQSSFRHMVTNASRYGRHTQGPVREIQTLMGDRWSNLLLHLLHYGSLRFSTLQRIIGVVDDTGISRRMLSFSLRAMERDGLVSRRVIAAVPPNVEYSLTDLGQGLWKCQYELLEWLSSHADQILAARQSFEQKDDPNDNER